MSNNNKFEITLDEAQSLLGISESAIKAQLRREEIDTKIGEYLNHEQLKAITIKYSLHQHLNLLERVRAVENKPDIHQNYLAQLKAAQEANRQKDERIKELELQTNTKTHTSELESQLSTSKQTIQKLSDEAIRREKKIKSLEGKFSVLGEKYKDWLLGLNVTCFLMTLVSSFIAFGVKFTFTKEDFYSIFIALVFSGILGIYTGATYWIIKKGDTHKINVALTIGVFIILVEFALHYLGFYSSLNIPFKNMAAIIGGLVLAATNWAALYLRK